MIWLELDSNGVTGSTGWTVHQIPAPYNGPGNDITDQVLPNSLRGTFRTGGTASTDKDKRVQIVVDTNVLPSEISIFFYFSESVTQSTAPECYQWMGPGTQIRNVGTVTGADIAHWWPRGHGMGMRTVRTATDKGIEILGHSIYGTTETITFRASGGGLIDVRFWYGLDGQPANNLCTLTGSATGGIAFRDNNIVKDVNANGFTQYTIEWDYATDGVPSGKPRTVLVGDDV
jgi:hypothetical protein